MPLKKAQPSPLSSPAGSKSLTGLMDPSELVKSRDVSSCASETAGRSEPRSISTRIDLGGGLRDVMVHKEVPSPTARIDIERMDMGSLVKKSEENAVSRREKLLSAQEKHPRGMTGRGELTLTGESYFTSSGNIVSSQKFWCFLFRAFDLDLQHILYFCNSHTSCVIFKSENRV